MSKPAERPDPDTLYVTDAELIRRCGVPEKVMRPVLKMLDADRKSGFPAKQKLFGDRRYWPAVRAYLDRNSGLTVSSSQQPEEVIRERRHA